MLRIHEQAGTHQHHAARGLLDELLQGCLLVVAISANDGRIERRSRGRVGLPSEVVGRIDLARKGRLGANAVCA